MHDTNCLMDGAGGMMMWGMGLVWVLVLVVLVLAAAALAKYLFGDKARKRPDE